MAKLPIRIVSDGTNVSGGLGHRSLGPSDGWVLESDLPAKSISGGVIPMTAAEYAAALGTSGMSFWLPFLDAGSGAVNTTPALSLGSATATFARATSATTFDSAGTAPILVNSGVARSYYDPVSHTYLGFLAEQAATNLLLNSKIDGTNLATQSVTVTAQAYTLSFYGTGTVTLSGTATGAKVGSGAYPTRSSFTFTPTAGSLTLTVTGTVQYAQLEAGSFGTSFIPTAGATVTRNADVLTYASSGNASAAAGSFYFEGGSNGMGLTIPLTLAATVGTDQVDLRISTLTPQLFVNSGGVQQAGITLSNVTANTIRKFAGVWGSNDFRACENGTLGTADTSGSVPASFTTIHVGQQSGGSFPNFPIKNVRIWARALTDSQLATITT